MVGEGMFPPGQLVSEDMVMVGTGLTTMVNEESGPTQPLAVATASICAVRLLMLDMLCEVKEPILPVPLVFKPIRGLFTVHVMVEFEGQAVKSGTVTNWSEHTVSLGICAK